MPYSTREKVIYGTFGFVVIGFFFLSLPTLIGVWMNYQKTSHIEDVLVCASKPSASCFTGNACLVSGKQRRCPPPEEESGHHHSSSAKVSGRHWNHTCSDSWFCTEPLKLADGSCCNEDDFCYLPDPTKVCRSGECVSSNYSLCKGSCAIDDDCSTYPVPISANVNADITITCNLGTCNTFVYSANPYPDPFSILNTTTSAQRSTAACLDATQLLVGEIGVDDVPYLYIFTWKCSKHNPEVWEP